MPSGKQYEMLFKLNAQANSGFKSTFTQAQAEFARLGSEIQSLNRVQADISAYQKQQSAIESTSKKLESLHRQQELLKQQIEETNKAGESTVALKRDEERLSESIRSTTVRLENQQDRLGATTLRLKEAGVSTKDLSGESARLSAQIGELSKRQEQAAESAQSYKDRAVDAFNAAGEALAAAGILAGIKEIGEAYIGTVQAAGEFGSAMSNVQALSGANARDMAALNAQAKELGATTKFTAMESGEAMGYMGMAGWNARQMLSGMPGVLDLAAASGEDLAGVADIVTDSLTGFKMTAADTGEFVDVLATAASKSNTNVSMLGESFKYVAPLAGTLGYSAQDTAVMLGLMANSGIKASQAGTTLRTAITNLASPTKEQAAEMERLGISLTDTNGQMLPMLDMVGNLRGAFSGMSEAEQSAAASTIFGKEAMSGMLAIINASESDYQSLTQSIYKLYVLMSDGTLATEEIKAAVLAACSADTVRPLTDQVFVEDAEQVKYNIDFTYYTQTGSGRSAVEIQTAVDNAVREYIRWQDTKLGRDINPDELRERLYHTGIKRIELREPAFTKLQNDSLSVPQVGQAGEITVVNGGYEDE